MFECKPCNYVTTYSTHYKKHLISKKHLKKLASLPNNNNTSNNALLHNSALRSSPKLNITPPKDKPESNFVCNNCNIAFATKFNLTRHKAKCKFEHVNTDNSDISLLDNNICPNCNAVYKLKNTFAKHIISCKSKSLEKTIDSIQAVHKLELLEEKLKASQKLVELLQEQNKTTNNLAVGNMCNVNGLIQSNNGLIETNMRTITFLNKFMSNAPSLEHFNNEFKDPYTFYIDYDEHKKLKDDNKLFNSKDNILFYDEDKMTKDEYIIDHILYLQRTKQTVKFLVERLLYFYKKEGDAIKQSIWNIDMYRYNFTVCLKIGAKTIWHSDKQGQTTTGMILDPLLEFTCGIINKHLETIQEEMKELAKNGNTNELLKILKQIELLTEFTISVKNKELQLEIIKKLSPLMFFDITKYKEIVHLDDNSDIVIDNLQV
jgi:hypothetical protein